MVVIFSRQAEHSVLQHGVVPRLQSHRAQLGGLPERQQQVPFRVCGPKIVPAFKVSRLQGATAGLPHCGSYYRIPGLAVPGRTAEQGTAVLSVDT
jgi:hypothetical protein